MSLTDYQIAEVSIRVNSPPSVDLLSVTSPDVILIAAGNVGPPGPPGMWEALSQAEYDALNPPNPDTLYVIIQ
jgi:hypothetical protein